MLENRQVQRDNQQERNGKKRRFWDLNLKVSEVACTMNPLTYTTHCQYFFGSLFIPLNTVLSIYFNLIIWECNFWVIVPKITLLALVGSLPFHSFNMWHWKSLYTKHNSAIKITVCLLLSISSYSIQTLKVGKAF